MSALFVIFNYTKLKIPIMKNPFIIYTNSELAKMYLNEYVPWTRTGVLADGELRSIFESEEKYDHATGIIAIEHDFLAETTRRFVIQNS